MQESDIKRYRVTYYYLATGMEGKADIRDYGVYYVASEDEAKEQAIARFDSHLSADDKQWLKGCLSVKEEPK